MSGEELPPLYIDKAYIDKLTVNVDVVERLKGWWSEVVEVVGNAWDRLVGIDNNDNKKEGD